VRRTPPSRRRLGQQERGEGFWTQELSRSVSSDYGDVDVRFVDDPLAILNLGNGADSCLRLGRWWYAERRLLGWATNINVRVVGLWAACEERILARRTIGLSLQDTFGISLCPVSPAGIPAFDECLGAFTRDFAELAGLDIYPQAEVESTMADAFPEYIQAGTAGVPEAPPRDA
jgi:hypothetical protein